eukprot:6922749-Lingulodinium_polyedra.AAC.1
MDGRGGWGGRDRRPGPHAPHWGGSQRAAGKQAWASHAGHANPKTGAHAPETRATCNGRA